MGESFMVRCHYCDEQAAVTLMRASGLPWWRFLRRRRLLRGAMKMPHVAYSWQTTPASRAPSSGSTAVPE